MGDFPVKVSLQPVEGDIEGLRKRVQDQFNSPINVKLDMGEMGKSGSKKSVDQELARQARISAALKNQGLISQNNAQRIASETAAINKQTAAIRQQQSAMKLLNTQNIQAKRLITEKTQAIRTDTQFKREQSNLQAWANKYADNLKARGRDSDVAALITKLGSQSNFANGFAQAQNEVVSLKSELRALGIEAQSAAQKADFASRLTTDFNKLSSQAQNYYEEHAKGIEKNTALSAKWAEMRKKLDDPNIAKTGNIAKTREEYSALIRETEKAGAHLETVGQRLGRLFGAHFDTALVMFALHALQQALTQVYQNVVQLDGAMVDLQIASGMSRDDVRGLMTAYNQMAKELGATTLEMAQGADVWIRQGKSIEETNILLANSTMLSKLGQIDAAQSSKYLTSIMKGYNIEAENSIGIVDKLTAVDMAAATSAGDIATAMAETSVSARIAGLSIDKLIGQIAVIGEVTQDKILSHYTVMYIANPLNCWKPLTFRRGQSAAKLIFCKKVQRPSRKRVHASAWKWWVSDLSDNDMVCAI